MMRSRSRPKTAITRISSNNEQNFQKARLQSKDRFVQHKIDNIKSYRKFIEASQLTSGLKGQKIDFLQSRKQNYLNSCYNKRKQQLQKITKQNHRLYKRINSQLSNYSSKKLNKSCESCTSHTSKKSSRKQSKASQFENRRIIMKKNKKNQQQLHLQEKNIKQISNKQIQCFKRIFFVDNNQVNNNKVKNYGKRKQMKDKENIDNDFVTENKKIKNMKLFEQQIIFEEKVVSNQKLFRQKVNKYSKQLQQQHKKIRNRNPSTNNRLTKIFSEIKFKYLHI